MLKSLALQQNSPKIGVLLIVLDFRLKKGPGSPPDHHHGPAPGYRFAPLFILDLDREFCVHLGDLS
jgi:hypothetical protein